MSGQQQANLSAEKLDAALPGTVYTRIRSYLVSG